MSDKYNAIWLSNSSINDFLSCERLYYLKYIFRNQYTGNKISISNPYLSLGIAVHNVIENLKNIKTENREKEIKENLLNNFKKEWKKFSLKMGGFKNEEQEREFFERGENMIKKIINNPKNLLQKIIPESYFWNRYKHNGMLPNYFLSENDNLILCGNIDWLEYLENDNSIRIIDFKTGRNDENDYSFQFPIYYLLISNLDKNKKFNITEFAYWYLDQENKKDGNEHDEFHIIKIDEEKLKEIKIIENKILEIGKKIKKAREEKLSESDWICTNEKIKGEGCKHCRDFEKVYNFIVNKNKKENTEVEFLGQDEYGKDLFFIK